MSASSRRCEILLRRSYHTQPIPARWLTGTVIELRRRFGRDSCETQIVRGEWEDEDGVYGGELVRVFVHVEETPENRDFFIQFRDRMKVKCSQLAIWMASHAMDAL
jgi:hypothetical protein